MVGLPKSLAMSIFLFLFFFSTAYLRIHTTAFFSGLSDEQLLTVYFPSTVFSSTAVRVVTADRVYTSCIRSTAFFSRLSGEHLLINYLHPINASNRKRNGCTLLTTNPPYYPYSYHSFSKVKKFGKDKRSFPLNLSK